MEEQINDFRIALRESILDLHEENEVNTFLADELLNDVDIEIFAYWSSYTRMSFKEFGDEIERVIARIMLSHQKSMECLCIDPDDVEKQLTDNLLGFYVTSQYILSFDKIEGKNAHKRMHS